MSPTIIGSPAANDDQVDLLDHVDPRSPSFFSDAVAVAACMVNGKGKSLESNRGILTVAIMIRCIVAACEGRPCFLTEIQDALEEACRGIRRHRNIATIFGRETQPQDTPESTAAMT